MKQNQLNTIISLWTNVCRFVLAGVFIFSGFVKAIDPLGTTYKIQDYFEALNLMSLTPTIVLFIGALLIAFVEFCLGVFLLFGFRRRISTLFVFILMIIMTLLTFWLAAVNPISDCGCFGDAIKLTNWQTFFKNVFLLIASIFVFRWGNLIRPLVSQRFDWLIELYTFLFIGGMMYYSLKNLPMFDFRPYHIGANIKESMEIPEGESPTEYETFFILEKDGKQKEFTLDNYPDSTWTFVDSRTVVKKRGYEPLIHDFSIVRQDDGEDITEAVLNDVDYSFLLVAHQLKRADDSRVDLINELYDYCIENGYAFYCLTASPDEDIRYWQERTGAEYPFAITDDTTLRTIIRSNPGLVLLKKGMVVNKWSVENIPDEYQLTDKLDKLPLGQINQRGPVHRIMLVLGWFVLPLFLLSMIDVGWGKYKNYKKKQLNS